MNIAQKSKSGWEVFCCGLKDSLDGVVSRGQTTHTRRYGNINESIGQT